MGELIQFPAARMRRDAPTLTKAELAARLRMSKRWVDYRMAEGMPFRKDPLSRLVEFDYADVMDWLGNRRTG